MRLRDCFVSTATLAGGPDLGKEGLLGQLLGVLAEEGHLAADALPGVRQAVLRREQLGSTGIGRGLAFPHARHVAVARPLGVLAVARPPVDYDSIDGEPVDVIALHLTPSEPPGPYRGPPLPLLGAFLHWFRDETFCRALRAAGSPEEVADLLWDADGGVTEAEWPVCTHPRQMLRRVRPRASERKLYLFLACCTRAFRKIFGEQHEEVAILHERYADGQVTPREMRRHLLRDLPRLPLDGPLEPAWEKACRAVRDLHRWLRGPAPEVLPPLCDVLRCLFGNPFRPAPAPDPAWLGWGDRTAVRLAEAIYEERAFDRMPILGDALEDAGCGDTAILEHLRGPGPHARGCFVLDVLTGRG